MKQDRFNRQVIELVAELRESIASALAAHGKVDGTMFACALAVASGELIGGALKKAGCPDEDQLRDGLERLMDILINRARRKFGGGDRLLSSIQIGDDDGDGPHHVVLGSVNRDRRTVEVDPRFWEDLAKAPPEVQAEAKKIVAAMKAAVEALGPGASRKDFKDEVERRCGKRPEAADGELPEEVKKLLDERANTPVTRH